MDFFEAIKTALSELPLAVQIVALMVAVAIIDFAAAVVEAVRSGTFHGTLLGKWVADKGLPIITVALLYGADQAVKLFTVEIGDFDLGLFGALAYAQGISFIAQEGFSIVKHLQAKPMEQPVPDETTGG
jgi:hypothetical protein